MYLLWIIALSRLGHCIIQTTDEKLLVNNIMELISDKACEKTIDIFDNKNVEHMKKTLYTSYFFINYYLL